MFCRLAVASSREDAWIETSLTVTCGLSVFVASSREDAWIETARQKAFLHDASRSRPPARTRGLKLFDLTCDHKKKVASSREDAWIETYCGIEKYRGTASRPPARTRGLKLLFLPGLMPRLGRVLPRGRVD